VSAQIGYNQMMEFDDDKITDTVLALLTLTMHDENEFGWRAWKNYDWSVLDRLHEAGYISDPKTKHKSVTMTPDGIQRARKLFDRLFGKRDITNG